MMLLIAMTTKCSARPHTCTCKGPFEPTSADVPLKRMCARCHRIQCMKHACCARPGGRVAERRQVNGLASPRRPGYRGVQAKMRRVNMRHCSHVITKSREAKSTISWGFVVFAWSGHGIRAVAHLAILGQTRAQIAREQSSHHMYEPTT